MIQLQTKKANKLVIEVKDYIISTRIISYKFIGMLNGDLMKETDTLPTNEHPFDHYVLYTELERK
jgi:hypothetical protein